VSASTDVNSKKVIIEHDTDMVSATHNRERNENMLTLGRMISQATTAAQKRVE